jgi:predicted deacylase
MRSGRAIGIAALAGLACLAACAAVAAQDFPITEPPPKPAARPEPPPKPKPKSDPAPAPAANATAALQVQIDVGPPELAEFVGPPELHAADAASAVTTSGATPGAATPFTILDELVQPGERREFRWKVGDSFAGGAETTPVVVLHGSAPGPRLCMTAAIHGDELNGVEVARRVVNDIDPAQLTGTVISVPIVNLLGFSRGSRYLPDRRDLNRYFPGTNYGSAASRIASSLFRKIIVHCDALVDFHTGSFDRANLPQVRGDLTIPSVLEFTSGFGATPVLHSPGTRGMLRLAATDYGIPAVTFEVGAPLRLEPDQIDFAVQAMVTLMHKMGMTRSFRMWAEPQATFYESRWVRSDSGGMLFSGVRLGDRVREGQRLGKVVDPVQNQERDILSPFNGRVIGMALNQVVLPGFAAYHIGIQTSEQAAAEEAAQAAQSPDAIEGMEGDQLNDALGDPRAGSDEGGDAPPPRESDPPGRTDDAREGE